MMGSPKARVWSTWAEVTAQRVAFLELLRRGVTHIVRRQLSYGWHGWVDATAGGTAHANRVENALKTMMNQKLSRGWIRRRRSE